MAVLLQNTTKTKTGNDKDDDDVDCGELAMCNRKLKYIDQSVKVDAKARKTKNTGSQR